MTRSGPHSPNWLAAPPWPVVADAHPGPALSRVSAPYQGPFIAPAGWHPLPLASRVDDTHVSFSVQRPTSRAGAFEGPEYRDNPISRRLVDGYELDFEQVAKAPKQFKLGHLGTLNQVIVALGKTIRAMADGGLDSQVGSRICNGLGIMRQCLETRSLDQLGERLDQLENTRGEGISYGTAKHDQPTHVAH
jgi:hypothetical protein